MDTKNNFNIGKRIQELRTRNGLSQEKLALRASITTAYLGLLERNQKNPTVKIIEQLCNQLNISLSEFFADSTPPILEEDSISLQITAQISDRTNEEKLLILQVIKDMLKFCDLSKAHPLEDMNQVPKKE